MQKRQILVTDALIYANGDVHLGHMLGYVQSDIWVRFQKMRGHECHYICGSDTHGTPIMLKAKELGQDPLEMVKEVSERQLEDFNHFGVQFDYFDITHSETSRQLVEQAYLALEKKGDIETNDVEQAYDPVENMFLPDRFVKGTCPKCGATDQYGDSCEACSATYDPKEIKDPISQVSGQKPIYKSSTHYFFKLSNYLDTLQTWLNTADLQAPVVNKLREWFESGLANWDISRDAPYFGFEIPGAKDKFFYVWLDAPIGYLAAFKNYDASLFDQFWQKGSETELYHFIGKDITYFHALFWPAVLSGAGYRLPSGVFTHGFLTVDGEKMSKSRGTFITARKFLAHGNPEHLRYYFAAKLNDSVEDIDLDFADFMQRANSDLVGKFVNIASRSAGFIKKKFEGRLSAELMEPTLFDEFKNEKEAIAECYEKRQYSKAMRLIMALADKANQFVEQHQPWTLAKDEATLAQVQPICTQALNCFMQLCVYLKPVLPETIAKAEAFLNIDELNFDSVDAPLLDHAINKFKPLMMRIEQDAIDAIRG